MPSLAEALHETRRRLEAAGFDEAEIEAEVLLRLATGLTREQLYGRFPDPTAPDAEARLEALLARRLAHEPLAYIVGRREFYGLELECTPSALIPRPETELLVELALEWVKGQGSRVSSIQMLDVGTGSGAIAVAIAVHAPDVRVVAIDPERPALLLARRNAEAHGVAGRIGFVQASLLEALREPVDMIVANLPYVSTREYERLAPEIREHEPRAGLLAGERGTEVIDALLAQAPTLLARPGLLLAEHAWDQGEPLCEAAATRFPGARIETRRDLAGEERALVVETDGWTLDAW